MEYLLTDHQTNEQWWAFRLEARQRVYACSAQLRRLGIRPGMSLKKARRLAPHMRVLTIPPDLTRPYTLQ